MNEMKATRDAYGEALVELGKKQENIVVIDSDVGSSCKSICFGEKYPDRYFNVGIAECNMCAMAAGFASAGKIPFVNTFAVFMTSRAADPVNSLIAYTKLNVKLAGNYSGLSDSYDGASHHAISDIAYIRALPNMQIVSVCDAVEAKKATIAIANINAPVYLRLSRADVPTIFDENYDFSLGKGVVLKEGSDIALIATGYMVQKSLQAAEMLKGFGINARVVNIHTIKPIDEELIISCAKETGLIVTVEEHNIEGGLGSIVAQVLARTHPVPMHFIGIHDEYAESGDYEQLLTKYGLDSHNIVNEVKNFLDGQR